MRYNNGYELKEAENMTWKRSIKTLFAHPMYFVITLLPVLLMALLSFPFIQKCMDTFELIFSRYPDFSSMEGSFTPGYMWNDMDTQALVSAIIPMVGTMLLFALIALLTVLFITPIALQYLGDASTGTIEPGFAGRGIRRMWWKPFVFGLLAFIATQIITAPISDFASFGAILSSAYSTGSWRYVPMNYGFGIISWIIGLIVTMGTLMFRASIATEDLPFFTAVGKAFQRTFQRFGRLLGAILLTGVIGGVIGLIIIAAFFVPYIISIVPYFSSLEGSSIPISMTEIMEIMRSLMNQMAFAILAFSLVSWLLSCFLISYAIHLTREMTETPQPVLSETPAPEAGQPTSDAAAQPTDTEVK
jgi:hypothetical protein